jgi:hypothetical protein
VISSIARVPGWRRLVGVLGSPAPAALVSLAVAAVGCASEAGPVPDLRVIAGCESEYYGACDILELDCRERVFSSMRCLRGLPDAVRPEIRTITRAEYEAELGAPTEELPDPEGEADDLDVEHALVLFGLARPADLSPANVVELYSDTVPAYYSNADQRITLIDPGAQGSSDPGQSTLLLAHEFLHALQDQDGDPLGLEPPDTFDRYLASLGVIEGEATMFETFFGAAMWGLWGDVDFHSYFTSWVPSAEESFAGESPLLVAPRYFPYSYGARYVYNVYEAAGISGVRRLYQAMPASVLPMLLSVDELALPEPELATAPAAPASLSGFELLAEDTLGPWVFNKFLERSISAPEEHESYRQWRGDRFFVYSRGPASVTGIWLLRLDTPEAAQRLVSALGDDGTGSLSPSAVSVARARDVAIAVMDEPDLAEQWQASIERAQLDAEASPGQDELAALDARAAPPLAARLRERLARHFE